MAAKRAGLIVRAFGGLIDLIQFILIAQFSLPRAINEHNIRNWAAGGRVVLYQYTPIIYTWPLISVGFYSLILDCYDLVPPAILGWCWSITLILVLTTLLIDISRGALVVSFLLLALAAAVSAWLRAAYQISVEHYLFGAVSWFEMDFPRGSVLLVTASLGLLYFGMMVWRQFDSVITIQGDQLTIHRFASEALSYQAGGWALRAKFQDLLEYILGGGSGSLAIVHPVSGKELFVANHVPGFARVAHETRRRFSVTDVQGAFDPATARDKAA